MKIVKWGNKKIKVYFSMRKVEQLEKELEYDKGTILYGSSNIGKGLIYIRTNMEEDLQRSTLWHELNHFLMHSLGELEGEATVEIFARFIDEIYSRNKWIRDLY